MRRAHLIDLSLLLLLTGPLVAAEPSKFTLPIPAAVDPLTVIGPASVCADQQIALWNGASNTSLQCSALTVADTTGNLTGPSGGFSIIGGTGAGDDLILDGSAGTAGSVTISETGAVVVPVGAANAPTFLSTDSDSGIFFAEADLRISKNGTALVGILNTDFFVQNRIDFGAANDAYLVRDGTGVIAQRNTSSAQTFRLYGTGDGGTGIINYERLSLSCDGTADCTIATETAGTGGDDVNLNLTPAGVGTINLTRARLVPSAAPPVTCAAGTEGALYLDSDTHKLCYCNATGWVLASDDTTGCS